MEGLDGMCCASISGTELGRLLWRGRLISVQPRIRLMRSFDQRSHRYLGYVLGDEESELVVGIEKGAHCSATASPQCLRSGPGECTPMATGFIFLPMGFGLQSVYRLRI